MSSLMLGFGISMMSFIAFGEGIKSGLFFGRPTQLNEPLPMYVQSSLSVDEPPSMAGSLQVVTPLPSCTQVNCCPVVDLQLATPPGDETQVNVPPSLHPEQVLTPSLLGTQYTLNSSAFTGLSVNTKKLIKAKKNVEPRKSFIVLLLSHVTLLL